MATQNQTAEFYDSIATSYEEAFSHNEGLISFIRTSLTYLHPGSHVLDIGCGTGRPVATLLAAGGHRVTGIDISAAMVERSRAAVPSGTFEVADMQAWEPPPLSPPLPQSAGLEGEEKAEEQNRKKFDAIFCILSLFTLSREGMEGLVAKMGRWVKPRGGLLFLCSMAAEDLRPDPRSAEYDADGLCARDVVVRFLGTDAPVTLFTRAGWEVVLRTGGGFETVDTRMVRHIPPPDFDSDEEPHYYVVARKKY